MVKIFEIGRSGVRPILSQADTLNNDERYRPAQFAAMLATLSEPESEVDTDIETEDEPIE